MTPSMAPSNDAFLSYTRFDDKYEAPSPDAFLSYTRADDEYMDGWISDFRKNLERAVRVVSGQPFRIFQDIDGIGLGEHWPTRLDDVIKQATFFLPMLTPSFFQSPACRTELERFMKLEEITGRADLILPVYIITSDILEKKDLRSEDHLANAIRQRQYYDLRDLAFHPNSEKRVKISIMKIARQIEEARKRKMFSDAISKYPSLSKESSNKKSAKKLSGGE